MNSFKHIEGSRLALSLRPTAPIYQSQVVLGSPRNDCSGLGICRMYMAAKPLSLRCPAITAWLTTGKTGRLSIRFNKADMAPGYLQQHFHHNFFQVYDPFDLPDWTCRKLALQQHRIEPGVYRVWETNAWLIIEF